MFKIVTLTRSCFHLAIYLHFFSFFSFSANHYNDDDHHETILSCLLDNALIMIIIFQLFQSTFPCLKLLINTQFSPKPFASQYAFKDIVHTHTHLLSLNLSFSSSSTSSSSSIYIFHLLFQISVNRCQDKMVVNMN